MSINIVTGAELEAFTTKQGWTLDGASEMVVIPSNPDTQIESTVVQENINLSRNMSFLSALTPLLTHLIRACKNHLAFREFHVILAY
jgi:hypothetical protein